MRRLLPVAGFFLAAIPASAVQDTNSNGLSDVWERHYNGGNLFSGASHHAPTADPDGDGWSNFNEAIAGTDPFSGELPQGFVQTTIVKHPDAEGLFILSWPSAKGKVYKLAMSADLVSWADFGELMPGTDQDISLAVDAIHQDGTIPGRLFWRVKIEDDDPDGDSLTTWEELALGLKPYHPDSDLDGIPDGEDDAPLDSATLADPDNTRAPAGIATNLRAFWDFESQVGTSFPAVFPDRSGNNRTATSSFDGPALPGMPSRSANIGVRSVTAAGTILQNQTSWSISGWIRLGEGNIADSPVDGAGFGNYRLIYAHYDQQGTSPLNQPLGKGNALAIRKAPAGEMWMVGGYQQTVYFNEPPNINGNPKTVISGNTFTLPAGTTDDGQWHHFAVTRTTGGFGYKVYLDGAQVASLVVSEQSGLAYDADTRLTLGRLYPGHFPTAFPEAFIDRVRVHGRVLSPAEVGNLYRQDIDGDGLWDITECKTALWRDANSDGVAVPSEHSYSSSPLEWQPPDHDTDGDGASDLVEQAAGTAIDRADTDGDLIPDGWELKYPSILNPLNPNDAGQDPDGDGLTNLKEWQYNTIPTNPNSDGGVPGHPDTVNDGTEVGIGSNPNDPTDGGQAPSAAEKVTIVLGVGDKSGSKSEDYVLHCYRIDRETGEEKRVYTLRSGGYGQYLEQPVSVFRKGESYSFQIHWQGTNNNKRSAGPGVSAEGPDFDYSFKVQPQGDHGGILIDSWNPSDRTLDPSRHLLNNDANDVAEDAAEFKRNYSNRRVVLYSIQTHTVDRMFAGAVTILPGFEQMELAITGPDTGRDFGTHGYLMGGGNTRVYDSVKGMLGYQDRGGTLVNDPRVWFLRDSLNFNRVEFYLVSGAPGDAYGKVKVEAKVQGQSLGSIERTLQANAAFAESIDLVTGWAAGRGFAFDTGGLGGGPVPMGGPPADGAGLPDPHFWATPTLIPFMLVGHQVEGPTIVVRGLGEGVVAGLKDDLEFVKLVLGGVATVADWSYQVLLNEIGKWQHAPRARISELHAMVTDFFDKQVFEPLGNIAADLTTIEGFKKRFWQAVIKGITISVAINTNIWHRTVDGMESWFDDFGNRMTAGAERAAWLGTPLAKTGLLAEGTPLFREQCYTFGYTFGYICEQVAIGALSGGTMKIAQVAVKGGVTLAGNVAKRTAAAVAIRGHWMKKIMADAGLGDAVIRAMYERGMLLAAVAPTGPSIKKCAFEVLETFFSRQGANRTIYNLKKLLDDITPDGSIRKLLATEGGEALIHRRAAQLAHLLGDECDETIMKNFLKVADERLIVVRADGSVDEFFESFFRAMEGNPSLLQHADTSELALSSMTPNGKARLKHMLSDPDPGNPWKLDDPQWVPNEDPPIPHNYWARGMLLEIDAYKRIYKPQGYAHHATAAGYDYSGAKWVQVKSLSNPNAAVQRMEKAIEKLVQETPDQSQVKLHILKKPGTDSNSLQLALESYRESQGLVGRLEIVIEPYNLGPQ